MAITYNPYDWEIRPDPRIQCKKLLEERKYLIDRLLSAHNMQPIDNVLIGRIIYQLTNIQEQIDILYIRHDYGDTACPSVRVS